MRVRLAERAQNCCSARALVLLCLCYCLCAALARLFSALPNVRQVWRSPRHCIYKYSYLYSPLLSSSKLESFHARLREGRRVTWRASSCARALPHSLSVLSALSCLSARPPRLSVLSSLSLSQFVLCALAESRVEFSRVVRCGAVQRCVTAACCARRPHRSRR